MWAENRPVALLILWARNGRVGDWDRDGSAGLARPQPVERLREIGPTIGRLVEDAAPQPLAAFGDGNAAHALVKIARRIVAQHPQETAIVAALLHGRERSAQQPAADAAILRFRTHVQGKDLADIAAACAGVRTAGGAVGDTAESEADEADDAAIGFRCDDDRLRVRAVADDP